MQEQIIEEEAKCTRCGAVYDPIIYKMKEKCAIPRRKGFGSKDSGYCNGNLELIRGKYQLLRKTTKKMEDKEKLEIVKQEIGFQIDEISVRVKELQKCIISIKALKCPKCKEIIWTEEDHKL